MLTREEYKILKRTVRYAKNNFIDEIETNADEKYEDFIEKAELKDYGVTELDKIFKSLHSKVFSRNLSPIKTVAFP